MTLVGIRYIFPLRQVNGRRPLSDDQSVRLARAGIVVEALGTRSKPRRRKRRRSEVTRFCNRTLPPQTRFVVVVADEKKSKSANVDTPGTHFLQRCFSMCPWREFKRGGKSIWKCGRFVTEREIFLCVYLCTCVCAALPGSISQVWLFFFLLT